MTKMVTGMIITVDGEGRDAADPHRIVDSATWHRNFQMDLRRAG